MIDLVAKRKENFAKLNGEISDNGVIPYTVADVTNNAEVCWNIISLATRKEMVDAKGKNGSTYKREGKNLQFPDLMEAIVVGQKATTPNAKQDIIERTNLETMREMYQIRNKMNKFYIQETVDDYAEFFKSVVEILDGYAESVVADTINSDDEFLNRVNAARGC